MLNNTYTALNAAAMDEETAEPNSAAQDAYYRQMVSASNRQNFGRGEFLH